MSAPELYGAIGSLAVDLAFCAFPKPIGVGFSRIGRSIWKRHEHDVLAPFSQGMRKLHDEAKAPKQFRLLGIIFLIQAVVFLILSAVR
jgi:hypothetical protein